MSIEKKEARSHIVILYEEDPFDRRYDYDPRYYFGEDADEFEDEDIGQCIVTSELDSQSSS